MNGKIWCWISIALTFCVQGVWGSGFRLEESHVAYMGQAAAGITLAENAGVVATLPAAMVRLPRDIHVLAGLTAYQSQFLTGNLDGPESTRSTHGPSLVPHVYALHNNGKSAWGIGQHYPFGVKIEWPQDWAGRRLYTEQALSVGYTSLVAAFAMSDRTSVGAGVIRAKGKALQKKYATTPLLPGVEVFSVVEAEATEWTWNLSYLYDTGTLAAGLIHSPKYTLRGEGDVKFEAGNPLGLTDQGVKANLLMPSVTEVGFSLRSSPQNAGFFIEVAAVHTGWSNYRELRIRFDTLPDSVTVLDWKDTTGYKMGLNFVFARNGASTHRLRAGAYQDESASVPDKQRPGEDGAGRKKWALGYGYEEDGLVFDLAYMLIKNNDSRTSRDNPFPARYRGKVDMIAIGVGSRW